MPDAATHLAALRIHPKGRSLLAAVDDLREQLGPKITSAALISLAADIQEEPLQPPRDASANCRRCGRRMLVQGMSVTHVGADGRLVRGCRAASYTATTGWDENIPRSWSATLPTPRFPGD